MPPFVIGRYGVGSVADSADRGLFGRLLRQLRLKANLSQQALAVRSGLSVQAIGMLERGDRRSPRPSTVKLLASALRLPSDRADALVAASQGSDPLSAEPGTPAPLADVSAAAGAEPAASSAVRT